MSYSVLDVMEFIEDNDVKFVRLAFCDLFGMQRNVAIMSDRLLDAIQDGVSFDASNIDGFENVEKGDLLLFPDPATMSVLPWRPQQGKVVRFLCDIRYPDGSDYDCDTRKKLQRTLEKVSDMGMECTVGFECEFYLFKTDENGEPTKIPHDKGKYLDVTPNDKGENLRREVCLSLEEMGIRPQSSHHESGPGQNEIDFKYSAPLLAAENMMTFKSVIKAIASKHGLFASFMPRPIIENCGSGLHVNLSLIKENRNIFADFDGEDGKIAKSFMAGVLNRAKEMAVFTNPLGNSYERLGKDEAPIYVSWSKENRSQLIRIPTSNRSTMARMEYRAADPSINPYLVLNLLIAAGIEGMKEGLELPISVDKDLYNLTEDSQKGLEKLPLTLKEAVQYAENSEFLQKVLGKELVNKYLQCKRDEISQAEKAPNAQEYNIDKYFEIV